MLHYVAENPWPAVGVLAFVALFFFIRLRMTQDGVYLIRMGATLAVMLGLILLEQLWVTENERIEAVVHELADGMANSDVDRVIATFAPRISIGMRNRTESMEVDPDRLRETLKNLHFDWLRITRLQTHAGEQTKQGSAEFRVNAAGSITTSFGTRPNFATGNSEWSLGLRKMADGSWKVTRINPVSLPYYAVNAVETYLMMISRGTLPIGGAPRRLGSEPSPPPGRGYGLPIEAGRMPTDRPLPPPR